MLALARLIQPITDLLATTRSDNDTVFPKLPNDHDRHSAEENTCDENNSDNEGGTDTTSVPEGSDGEDERPMVNCHCKLILPKTQTSIADFHSYGKLSQQDALVTCLSHKCIWIMLSNCDESVSSSKIARELQTSHDDCILRRVFTSK
jgi:hypothetical protein